MTEILTAAQMRGIEAAAIESGEVTGLELMERAGRGVVEAVYEHWPEFGENSQPLAAENPPRRAVVLCGPGNNGGDGYVVARLLLQRGWEVQVLALGDPEKLPSDAKENYRRWISLGEVTPLSERAFRADPRGYANLYVDALFGTGIKRPVTGEAWNVLSHMAGRNGDDYRPYTVAIDAPSGLCLDSGRLLGTSGSYGGTGRFAALTVAFDSPKLGHFLAEGPHLCGRLVVKDIGLQQWRQVEQRKVGDRQIAIQRPAHAVLVDAAPMVRDDRLGLSPLILPQKGAGHAGQAHKFSYGHALIVSGGAGRTGAARLSARAALRVGAGLVSLAVPPEAGAEVAAQITALMMRTVSGPALLSDMFEDSRLNAVCIGPGLGLDDGQGDLVAAVLRAKRSTVLDADALSLLARRPDLRDLVHDKCLLTPHLGEFARLFPDLYDRLIAPRRPADGADMAEFAAYRNAQETMAGPAYSKADAARDAAARLGCSVLLKGPDTVIASPEGRVAVHSAAYDRAAPWLATAGSGDVLSGLITGLLAMGQPVFTAAATGAWLHTECARRFGPGLIAEDLTEQIPAVLSQLPEPE